MFEHKINYFLKLSAAVHMHAYYFYQHQKNSFQCPSHFIPFLLKNTNRLNLHSQYYEQKQFNRRKLVVSLCG